MSDNKEGSWLDDPEWEELRRKQSQPGYKLSRAEVKQLRQAREAEIRLREEQTRQRQQAAVKTPAETSGEPKKIDVSLNITLPALNVGKAAQKVKGHLDHLTPVVIKKKLKKRTRKQLMISSAVMVVLVVGVIGVLVVNNSGSKGNGDGKGVLAEQTAKPDFKPILPNGKTDETTSGKVAYEPQKRVVSFTDKIGTTDITVSEQELPEAFKSDPEAKVQAMAKDLYVTEVISSSNPRAYLGTSIKGPQTVIFTKNGLLIFIQSQSRLDKDQWADYVTRLL